MSCFTKRFISRPRTFPTLTKPKTNTLRLQRHTAIIYITDIITKDDAFESCLIAVIKIVNLNLEKSRKWSILVLL